MKEEFYVKLKTTPSYRELKWIERCFFNIYSNVRISKIDKDYENRFINAKSLIGLISLNLQCNEEILVIIICNDKLKFNRDVKYVKQVLNTI